MVRLAAGTAFAVMALVQGDLAAQTVYDNGAPLTNGYIGNPDLNQALIYEGFTLTSAADIGEINFWALQWHNAADNFAGSIYWTVNANVGGTVGASLYSGLATQGTDLTRIADGMNQGGLTQYLHTISTNFTLAAGSYYLGIHNGPLTNSTASGYYWITTAWNGTGHAGNYQLVTQGMYANYVEYAFNLGATEVNVPSETVPEPATMALVATGLAGMAAARRRRQA